VGKILPKAICDPYSNLPLNSGYIYGYLLNDKRMPPTGGVYRTAKLYRVVLWARDLSRNFTILIFAARLYTNGYGYYGQSHTARHEEIVSEAGKTHEKLTGYYQEIFQMRFCTSKTLAPEKERPP
jgi:hypothetical protein